MNTISVEELEKIDSSKITIVDVRPADQYSRGSFPGAVNIPLDEFDEKMEAVDKDLRKEWSLWTGRRWCMFSAIRGTGAGTVWRS